MGKKSKRYVTVHVDKEIKEALDKYKLVHNKTHQEILKEALVLSLGGRRALRLQDLLALNHPLLSPLSPDPAYAYGVNIEDIRQDLILRWIPSLLLCLIQDQENGFSGGGDSARVRM